MSKNHEGRKAAYQFHPLEIAFCGFSGVGKTTLLIRLLSRLSPDWKLAYVKHDAHRFEVDQVGKDTYMARAAGAGSAFISNADAFAWMGDGAISVLQRRSLFLDYDALFIEGYKNLDVDKILLLDADLAILDQIHLDHRVKAFVGEGAEAPRGLPGDRPYFQRDAIESLVSFIEGLWQERIRQRPLRGLVLAGGRSSRMGQDKGLLQYAGETEARRLYRQLTEDLGLESFLSLREGQWTDEQRQGMPVLADRFLDLGPFSGILTAMQSQPDAAWLIVACDLPFLKADTLRHLLKQRKGQKIATAFQSAEAPYLPEPLCSIYEPHAAVRLFEALALGINCPRKVLLNSNSHLLPAFDKQALTNVNTPDEFRHSLARLSDSL